MRVRAGLALAAIVTVATGCGGSERVRPREPAPERVVHIHGLGINPGDDALILATHRGLFRAGPDDTAPRRLRGADRDLKGLAITAADRFLVSGHAGASSLGLLASRDAGQNWLVVAREGDADLHVVRAVAKTLYGVESNSGRLSVSHDGGRTWNDRVPPAPLIDLVVDARNPERLIASSAQMLFASADGGRSWWALSTQHSGLLAWPAPGALYLVAADGAVLRSKDAGRTWVATGQSGGRPDAFMAYGADLYVALPDNTVEMSSDRGRNWSVRVAG